MYDRIIEIIVFVIAELRKNKTINEVDLGELKKLGYSKSEISTAFSWIVDKLEFSGQNNSETEFVNKGAFRVFHEVESELFTKEALGEMMQLHTFGLLSNEHIESLIEKTVMTGGIQVDSNRLRSYVADVVFKAESVNEAGSRFMLQGNDTIN